MQVLRESPDLTAYVDHVNHEAAETGLDSPIVRKAIGKVYYEQARLPRATEQLRLAFELQPRDEETHAVLIQCYDQLDDQQAAVNQLLELVQWNRRGIELYRDMGERLHDDPAEQERAFTSIVEVQPHEAESHAMLALTRQNHDRWDESIPHWKRVAELRSLEPTGLIGLATAQAHLQDWAAARETLDQLSTTTWPSRFTDVARQVWQLRQQVDSKSE